VIDGPFIETKELVAGYWIWEVKSKEEAIEWVKRCPNPMPGTEAEIEIRQIFSAEDFGAEFTPEARGQEERVREQAKKNSLTGYPCRNCGTLRFFDLEKSREQRLESSDVQIAAWAPASSNEIFLRSRKHHEKANTHPPESDADTTSPFLPSTTTYNVQRVCS
jgi:hypothetical protein